MIMKLLHCLSVYLTNNLFSVLLALIYSAFKSNVRFCFFVFFHVLFMIAFDFS